MTSKESDKIQTRLGKLFTKLDKIDAIQGTLNAIIEDLYEEIDGIGWFVNDMVNPADLLGKGVKGIDPKLIAPPAPKKSTPKKGKK
jgi:hypothetical protein